MLYVLVLRLNTMKYILPCIAQPFTAVITRVFMLVIEVIHMAKDKIKITRYSQKAQM